MNQAVKHLVLGLSLISVFNKPLSYLIGVNLNLLDEGILFLSLLIFLNYFLFSKKVKLLYLLVFFFLVYSITISMLFGLNNNFIEIVFQSLVTLKFFIITLALFLLFRKNMELIQKMYKILLVLLLIGCITNIFLGENLNHFLGMQVFSRPGVSIMRYGGFVTPNHLAYFMVLSIGLVLNNVFCQQRMLSRKDWAIIGLYIIVILLTDSRSALLGVFLFFTFFYKKFILQKVKILISFVAMFFISLILLLICTDIIETVSRNISDSFSLESYYIRGIMVNMGFQIVYLYFPIGTGAATFGSVFSEGSQVYKDFGVSQRSFFIEKSGIYDSSLASWMGEYGIIGLVFLGVIFYYLRSYLESMTLNSNKVMINSLLLVFLFFSLTTPVFTNNVYIFLSLPIFYLFSLQIARITPVKKK